MISKWRIVVVVILLVTAAVVFLGPLMFAPAISDAPAVADNAPRFERSVQVEDGRLVLP